MSPPAQHSLPEEGALPKPTTASLKGAVNWEPDAPRPPPRPLQVTLAGPGGQGCFSGCHMPPPPRPSGPYKQRGINHSPDIH